MVTLTITNGYEDIQQLAKDWPASKTEKVTKIPVAKLKELVTVYINSSGAALYCSTGVNMGGHGVLAYWLQEVINAISGNLDKKGGTLVGKGIIDFIKFGAKKGTGGSCPESWRGLSATGQLFGCFKGTFKG